ncbi:hypothetical protein [Ureibacillus chungkukjangi]|uniref:YrhC-like protein n=1 Tax=Ureibacillus chungkukjangi TaxID=1202712 RepID=A0A318TQ25_9BACL|nr:hypothetical protein [Ureibacillus chungkukjangi]PYF06774.1 hypothetical protein BJ095_1076 [Ureibacillus chungkukjangi]
MNVKETKKQLIISSLFFVLFIIGGSIQIMSSPFLFVRGINLFLVISSAAVLGAFIREFYVVKEKIRNSNN